MANFVRHEPCPSCKSRNNLARYDDGGAYCFGCGYREGRSAGYRQKAMVAAPTGLVLPPDDTEYYFNSRAVEWFAKYGVTVDELIRHKIGWSPSREQVIYRFYDESGRLVLWQARNFRDGTTHKNRFITRGSPSENVVRYSSGGESTVVVVEDCVSALKVSRGAVAGMPCFRATLATPQIAKLSNLYPNIVVWLDSDKYKEARDIARRARLCGMNTKVVFTELDPKEYDDDFIRKEVDL